ncbi:hypothetical protein DVH24_020303 [Malus domestica]|uniref:Uncharacterized protein n=1 Tax=Malus domestica TaxID=3750 RepID=A0A498J6Y4_MALDO|nr:hypothetical protein DVH24_020303 [Malus domestica]
MVIFRERQWQQQHSHIRYEMGDVLDEWNADMLKQEVELQERVAEIVVVPKSKKKKLTFCVTPSCFCFRKAREVTLNERLSVIDEQKEETRLCFNPMRTIFNKYLNKNRLLPLSTCLMCLAEKTKKICFDNKGDPYHPYSRDGMGGVRKISLTQLAHIDANVESCFDKKILVCVSDPFDEERDPLWIFPSKAQGSSDLSI